MPDHPSQGDHQAKTPVVDGSGDGFLTAGPTVRRSREETRMIAGCAGGSDTTAGREANMTAALVANVGLNEGN
jgi:hypothetical protein